MSIQANPLPASERELVITRRFEAPPALVFRLFTDPYHAIRWWGPSDFPATELRMDVRPGGSWRGCLASIGDGRKLWQGGVFRIVEPPRKLVFTFAWDEAEGSGPETLVTILFEAEGAATRMTFRQSPFATVENRDGHRGGWTSCFDRLEDYVAGGAGMELG